MKVSVVTPTANRPRALFLLEGFLRRQTRQPDEWIVSDGGEHPARLIYRHSFPVRLLADPRPAGAENFTSNVINGVEAASGDVIVFAEDDDWMDPAHIERTIALLDRHPEAWAAGDDLQRYYNLPHRLYRTFDNIGASLCQTAIRRAAVDRFLETAHNCRNRRTYGLDTFFWRELPREQWAIERLDTVVGVKGLPGEPGLGIGHRPSGPWKADENGLILRQWIGDEAALYDPFTQSPQTAV